jgi:hypothetical protein
MLPRVVLFLFISRVGYPQKLNNQRQNRRQKRVFENEKRNVVSVT